jgi:hypothetical protein
MEVFGGIALLIYALWLTSRVWPSEPRRRRNNS